MRIPKQIKKSTSVIAGAILFLASLAVVMCLMDELERQGNMVEVSTYEIK